MTCKTYSLHIGLHCCRESTDQLLFQSDRNRDRLQEPYYYNSRNHISKVPVSTGRDWVHYNFNERFGQSIPDEMPCRENFQKPSEWGKINLGDCPSQLMLVWSCTLLPQIFTWSVNGNVNTCPSVSITISGILTTILQPASLMCQSYFLFLHPPIVQHTMMPLKNQS